MSHLHLRDVTRAGEHAAIPSRLAEWIRALLGADVGLWYDIRPRGETWVTTDGHFAGAPDIAAHWSTSLGIPAEVSLGYTPDLPRKGEVNRFVELDEIVRVMGPRAEAMLDRNYRPFGLGRQTRALLYDGPRFLGWLGAASRSGRLEDAQRETLTRALPELRSALRAHHASGRLDSGEDAGVNALVFGAGTRLVHGSRAALKWTHTRRERVEAALRAFRHGGSASALVDSVELGFTRMDGLGEAHVLVTLSATVPALLSPLYDLSRRQREVGQLAAKGATAPEIGTMLGISPATVRVHLKAVYAVLDITSRAELGRIFEALE